MGSTYKIKLKQLETELKNRFKDIKLNWDFIESKGANLFFDIGFGEKFVIFTLPIGKDFKPENLVNFYSLEILFESVRRFIHVNPPKGFRVRFLITDSRDGDLLNLKLHIDKLGKERILTIINLDELGLGNEKLVINGLDSRMIFKINKVIKENGLNVKMIKWKKNCMAEKIPGINIIEFKSYPNKFIDLLPKDFFDEKRKNYATGLIFLIVTQVFKL